MKVIIQNLPPNWRPGLDAGWRVSVAIQQSLAPRHSVRVFGGTARTVSITRKRFITLTLDDSTRKVTLYESTSIPWPITNNDCRRCGTSRRRHRRDLGDSRPKELRLWRRDLDGQPPSKQKVQLSIDRLTLLTNETERERIYTRIQWP